jgi:glycosyltransferase involved in cell wall biosynthesis
VLLPNAIDTSRALGGDGAKLRAELGIAPGAPLVGAVGRLAPMKGFDHLLRAWPLVVERHPAARLVVFGGGELHGALAEEAARLGVAGSVVLAGFRADTENLYDALDVFVLPSVKDETVARRHARRAARGPGRPRAHGARGARDDRGGALARTLAGAARAAARRGAA